MDEFKVGDEVMLSAELMAKLDWPYGGTVLQSRLPKRRLVRWANGRVTDEQPEDLQRIHPAQPQTSAAAIMAYGAEKAELQRILTKRNATIGRLRAANRELRQAMIVKTEETLDAFPAPPRRRYGKVVKDAPEQASDGEPTPLPTVPPRVGGVYRLRDGREAECVKHDTEQSPTLEFLMRTLRTKYEFGVFPSGRFLAHRLDEYDLVAEISPPPEPAFTGPLEVGGWYEDQDGHDWQCQSIRIDFDSAILATCCRNYDRLIRDFHLDGSHVGKQLKLIRKVDPPGGES